MTPQFIATKVVIDIETGKVFEREGFWYAGPVSKLKKGRDITKTAGQGANALGGQASQIAKTDQGVQQGYRTAGDAGASTYFGPPDPKTGLGKATASQYELDKENIARTAADSVGVGQRLLASRGMQGSPGAMSSLINTTNRNADEMTTGAYNTALQRQQQLGLAGIGYNVGQQQLYDPNAPIRSGTSAYGTGAQAGADLNKMGSTFGDVMSGLGGIASLATMPINPTSAFGRLTGPKPPGS